MAVKWSMYSARRSRDGAPVAAGLGGFAMGAGLMFLLDPSAGRRRRAEARHKAVHAGRAVAEAGTVAARDLRNRGQGLVASAFALLRREQPPDEVLFERVRSKLGRLCSHPSAVEVACRDGSVELRGPILAAEEKQVIEGLRRVHGVKGIENHLEPHVAPENVPALQGGARRPGPMGEFRQERWSPAARVLAGGAGAVLFLSGAARRSLLGVAYAVAGLALLLRSIVNLPTRRVVGVDHGVIDLRKTIHVAVPREEAFAFFENFENFPRFMTHVREVRRTGDRWHWKVQGPAGVAFEWDAVVTERAPNEVLAWKTVEGASIESASIVRFGHDEKGTRLDVRLSYSPPAGAVGHAFAKLLGADPKKQMDDDLLRFKSLLEHGKATGREETVSREEVHPPTPPPHGS